MTSINVQPKDANAVPKVKEWRALPQCSVGIESPQGKASSSAQERDHVFTY